MTPQERYWVWYLTSVWGYSQREAKEALKEKKAQDERKTD
jgi:hypothetical protein